MQPLKFWRETVAGTTAGVGEDKEHTSAAILVERKFTAVESRQPEWRGRQPCRQTIPLDPALRK